MINPRHTYYSIEIKLADSALREDFIEFCDERFPCEPSEGWGRGWYVLNTEAGILRPREVEINISNYELSRKIMAKLQGLESRGIRAYYIGKKEFK